MMIAFKHNIEVAHRLLNLPGKCQNIHGHSMKVTLKLYPEEVNEDGYAINGNKDVLEFGEVKQVFRQYLNETYDHHLLLNQDDPWAKVEGNPGHGGWHAEGEGRLPGLVAMPGDPSTENIAKWIAEWAADKFWVPLDVEIWETDTNAVGAGG